MELFMCENSRLCAYASSLEFFWVRDMNMDLSVRKVHSFIGQTKALREIRNFSHAKSLLFKELGVDRY